MDNYNYNTYIMFWYKCVTLRIICYDTKRFKYDQEQHKTIPMLYEFICDLNSGDLINNVWSNAIIFNSLNFAVPINIMENLCGLHFSTTDLVSQRAFFIILKFCFINYSKKFKS